MFIIFIVFPGGMFITAGTFISDSRVLFGLKKYGNLYHFAHKGHKESEPKKVTIVAL